MEIQKMTVKIAATFAVEPMKESVVSSMNACGVRATVELLPYRQMVPSPNDLSMHGGSERGDLHVLLIRWEDWLHDPGLRPEIIFQKGERVFSEQPRHRLPNNMEIAHQNRSETKFLFEEIFVDNVYLKHGITLPDDSCIFDVGANIGLFSLYAHQQCRNARLYAFEPIPPVFELLKANAAFYGLNATLFMCGLANESKEATLTYYPNYSIMSGFHPDAKQEKGVLEIALGNTLSPNPKIAQHSSLHQYIDGVLNKRLESQTLIAPLRTLSSVIKEYKIKRIDLLKIDVEKSELSVLLGIEENDWKMIRQIAMEIHDSKGDVMKEITRLLKEKGFALTVDADKSLANAGVFMLYALRQAAAETPSDEQFDFATAQENLTSHLNHLLVSLSSAPVTTPYLICLCPVSVRHPARAHLFQEMKSRITSELKAVSGVHVMNLPETTPQSSSSDFFATIGAMIASKYCALKRDRFPVPAGFTLSPHAGNDFGAAQ